MIINKNTNPDRDLYNLGANVIDIISASKGNDFGLMETFQELNKKEKVSLQLYLLALDWLFILGTIKRTNAGTLERCF